MVGVSGKPLLSSGFTVAGKLEAGVGNERRFLLCRPRVGWPGEVRDREDTPGDSVALLGDDD